MRFIVLIASICMQLCLGATYSWSLYVQPLRSATGLSQGTVQLPFTLFYFIFPATLFYANRIFSKWGPQGCTILGGLFFGSGWIVAGFGSVHFIFTALGIGVLAGLGAGLAYIVPITVCMRWFPLNKGLVTGVAVAGFGGGAAFVTQVAGWLMRVKGLDVFSTMTLCGSVFLILICLAGLVMKLPTLTRPVQISPKSLREMVGNPAFRLLYGAMLIGLAAGFVVNANLKEIQPIPDLNIGIMAVSLFAVANALGRIIWGHLFDRFNPAQMIQLNLITQAAVMMILPGILHGDAVMLGFAFLSGFNYGGILVIYAASAGHIWGDEHVATVYGWLFSANIPAALSPVLAGYCFDQTGSFFPILLSIGGVLLVAAGIVRRYRHLLQPL